VEDLAQKKARSALLFASNTTALYSNAKPGGSMYGIELTNDGIVLIGGGVPLAAAQEDALPLGAIGKEQEKKEAYTAFSESSFQV
jgi:uncharacterized protein GlcG (DUF336 family)